MLILASASPRRREILTAAGIPHLVRPTYIPEERQLNEQASTFVNRLAREKAEALTEFSAEDIVLAADTIVTIDDEIFGKPKDHNDARRMLTSLSGRCHVVTTAVCLRKDDCWIADACSTIVEFQKLTEEELDSYTQSGEGLDKAGSYAIQGIGGRFISSIQGCYHNVVGLPLSTVYRHLRTLHYL